MIYEEILEFWFAEDVEKQWFAPSPELDDQIKHRFGTAYQQACQGGLDDWQAKAPSALALTITLDQFPRNMFRGSDKSYQSDAKALEVAKEAIANGFDQQCSVKQRAFFYLPLMHSEALPDQIKCVELYTALGNENALDFAHQHHDIVARFGRFPHRNAMLGRQSSDEEIEFLKEHSGF